MKTHNLKLDLMVPMQINKDVIFNEALLKLDIFSNIGVLGFLNQIPERMQDGEKYIISHGEYMHYICYQDVQTKQPSLHKPSMGQVIFMLCEQSFYYFDEYQWRQVTSYRAPKFAGIKSEYTLPSDNQYHYLYMDGDANVAIGQSIYQEITIIIKQSHENSYQLAWSKNILWENDQAHELSGICNAIDIVKLYRLPETEHFLAKTVSRGLKF
jgi:hypothetical protein